MPKLITEKRQARMKEYESGLRAAYGASSASNVFKKCRNDLDLPMQTIANEAGISKQALIRTEQGTYDQPPERLIEYYEAKGFRENWLRDYEQFQVNSRAHRRKIFGVMPSLEWFTTQYPSHPFELLLSRWTNPETGKVIGTMNPTECAKLLCLNQSVLDNFINKPHRQKSVPGPLLRALRDNGYAMGHLNDFALAYDYYRGWKFNLPTRERSILDELKMELANGE